MPAESSAYGAVSTLQQEKHRQHAEQENRRSQPPHIVDRDSGNAHQQRHQQKQGERHDAAPDKPVPGIILKDAPEYEPT